MSSMSTRCRAWQPEPGYPRRHLTCNKPAHHEGPHRAFNPLGIWHWTYWPEVTGPVLVRDMSQEPFDSGEFNDAR